MKRSYNWIPLLCILLTIANIGCQTSRSTQRGPDELVRRADHFLLEHEHVLVEEYIKAAIEKYEAKQDYEGLASAYLTLARSYRMRDNFDHATHILYNKVIESYKKAEFNFGIAVAYTELAYIPGYEYNDDESCRLLKKAEEYYKKSKDENERAVVPIYLKGVNNFSELLIFLREEYGC